MKLLRALVADDEPLARDKLLRLIELNEYLIEAGTATSGTEAIARINELKPDVVFLDIRMPGATGLEVVNQITYHPRIIFTTAYEEFAVTAFELQAVDYLLKPFGKRRFESSVARLIERDMPTDGQVSGAFSSEPVSHVYARERGRVITIPVGEIIRVNAADDYAGIVTKEGAHLLRVRMKSLEVRLDPTVFVRIHRSTIINMAYMLEMNSCGDGRYEVHLADGSVCRTSRSGAARLREAIRR